MRLVEALNLEKDWDGNPLFEGASFSIDEGEKLGLVGANGSGKSSLLGLIAGRDEDFHGSLRLKPGLRIGFAEQSFEPGSGISCAELLAAPALELEPRLEAAGEELGRLEGRELEAALAAYGELRAAYEGFGAEAARERAERLLERLGLPDSGGREAALLSGGEKNVLSLARALMGEPELLILDEPGNHLDFAGLSWLEDFIRGERRAVIVVSHNRWLLERSVDSILELEGRRITRYSGGFSSYRIEKLKAQAGQGRDFEADRKRIERLEALVRKFAEIARSRPDPAWGKRLRARRSQLEREREAAAERPASEGARLKVSFSGDESKADFALIVRNYDKCYGERRLFDGAGLDLLVGERAAIVGPNGSGKTSLIRDIVSAEGSIDGGPIRVGPSMRIGYCAQEMELFNPSATVGAEFAGLGAREAEAEKLLRRYLFPREVMGRRVGELSGGERRRLEIARAAFIGANFLILDEPTNHLDIGSREALEEGLSEFAGTVLLVSHDRWFLEKTVDRIILLEGGKLLPYEGSFAEYWRDRGAPRPSPSGAGKGASPAARKLEDRAADLGRGRGGRGGKTGSPGLSAGEGPAARGLEERITSLEARKSGLEADASRAIAAGDYRLASRLAADADESKRLLDRLYGEWLSRG
jgi:ATPase subunit of ABC transporter with duplicated ATPase domains